MVASRGGKGPLATALTAAVLAAGRPSSAGASGFASARFGGELGNVTATNPTALYYNPAEMAFSQGTRLFVDGVLAFRRATWEHALSPSERPDPPGAEGANSGRARLSNLFGAPMIGVTTWLRNLAVGGAVYVPFGGRSRWARNDRFANDPTFPLAADGVQRWHSIEGALTFIYFTLGAAYRLGPVSVGVTGNLIESSVESTQAKNVTGNGDPDTTREGRATLAVHGMLGSFGVGVAIEAVAGRLWLAASYQAQPGLAPMALRGTLSTSYDGSTTTFRVALHQALPDIVRLGARHRPTERLELRINGDLTRWGVMQTQCVALEDKPCAVYPNGADATAGGSTVQNIRRRWNDTWALRAGGSYWVGRRIELFAGGGFETGAVPDETLDPGIIDGNSITGALGGRFEIGRMLFVAASYTHVQYLDRDNSGRSLLPSAELPTRRPDGGGRYTLQMGLVNLGVEKQF